MLAVERYKNGEVVFPEGWRIWPGFTERRTSPEVFHQHQVVDGGVHPGIENRAAVAGGGEADIQHLAEVASHGRGLACSEAEELQPVFTRGMIDIVDAFFEHHESPPNDPLQHF